MENKQMLIKREANNSIHGKSGGRDTKSWGQKQMEAD